MIIQYGRRDDDEALRSRAFDRVVPVNLIPLNHKLIGMNLFISNNLCLHYLMATKCAVQLLYIFLNICNFF